MALDKPLRPQEVEYLSFEGGGGKGNAFLGAIRALEDHSILRMENGIPKGVKGISGASAGAITAMLIGLGYDSVDISNILKIDFEDFFDGPNPSMKFQPGTRMNFVDNLLEYGRFVMNKAAAVSRLAAMIPWVPDIVIKYFAGPLIMDDGEALRKKITGMDAFNTWYRTAPAFKQRLADKLLKDLGLFRDSLLMSYGIFNGTKIHYFFNYLIDMKMRPDPKKKLTEWARSYHERYDVRTHWWTMEEVVSKFGIDLKFTSVNFRTGNIQILSRDTTPQLPLATAVRMSMSLPLIFKPVWLTKAYAREIAWHKTPGAVNNTKEAEAIWEGPWVDGGYFDNAPIRLFPGERSLLFRLGPRSDNNATGNIFQYLLTYLKIGLMGSGAGQITKTNYQYNKHIIELDITGTDLLKFNMSPAEQVELMNKNRKIVTDYFKSAGK